MIYWVCELRSQSLVCFSDMIRKMFWCSRDHSQVKTAFMLLFVQTNISHGGSLLSWPSIEKDFQSMHGSDCFCMQPSSFAPRLLNYQPSLRNSIVAKKKCDVEMVLKNGWHMLTAFESIRSSHQLFLSIHLRWFHCIWVLYLFIWVLWCCVCTDQRLFFL